MNGSMSHSSTSHSSNKPTSEKESTNGKRSLWRRMLRWVKRVCFLVFGLLAFYFLCVLIGLIPVNNDFKPTEDGVQIILTSTAIHADIVLPIQHAETNWRECFPAEHFTGDVSSATHVAIGWGDQGFFIETPTWSDLKTSTVLQALFWSSDSCLHVSYQTYGRSEAEGVSQTELPEDAHAVKISQEQYAELVGYIENSFKLDEKDGFVPITDAAYGRNDAFYEAHGSYHLFHTCNCWAGEGLQAAGVRTGWFTPLPKTMFWYLPE